MARYKRYRRYKKYRKHKKYDTWAIVALVILILLIMNSDKMHIISNFIKKIISISFVIGLLFIISFILIKFSKYKKQQKFLNRKYTIDQLLTLYKDTPTDFEFYIANLYKKLGYKNIKVTPASNDGGKDIIMFKDNKKYFVEVKLYSHKNWITREQIQKFHSACEVEKVQGIFITTSNFKKTAINWAKKCNIKLINGQELTKLI